MSSEWWNQQICLWKCRFDSKHKMEMTWSRTFFHMITDPQEQFMVLWCMEFHAPVIIIWALLACHFPKWVCYGFCCCRWSVVTSQMRNPSRSLLSLSMEMLSYTLPWYLCCGRVHEDVNRGGGIAAGGKGEHRGSPELQERATAETAWTQPSTQTGIAVLIQKKNIFIYYFQCQVVCLSTP